MSINKLLNALGWTSFFDTQFTAVAATGQVPGRVVGVEKTVFRVQTVQGTVRATLAGRFRYGADRGQGGQVIVGDWVVVQPQGGGEGVIRHLLERTSSLSRLENTGRDPRRSVGREHLLAANLDYVFIVTAPDGDFSVRRLERYLAAVLAGGAKPVIVLNKADLCTDLQGRVREVATAAPGVPVHPLSALADTSLSALSAYLHPGTTTALIGSSGVGKSTLVNRLLGHDAAPIGAVRADDKGRHTTTWRELFRLPLGGVLIDNPGLREIGVWAEEVTGGFADVAELAEACRYRDCSHRSEPGCAVRNAVAAGRFEAKRLENYRTLAQEAAQVSSWTKGREQQRREGKNRRARIKETLRAKGK